MRVPVSILTASGHGTYRGLFALACLLLWGCALAIVGDQRVARAQSAPLRYEEFEGWQAVPDWRSRPAPRDSRTLKGVFGPDPAGAVRAVGLGLATSSCIGQPVTPLCAVETDLACYARFDRSLCESAWLDFDDRVWFPEFAPPPGKIHFYGVIKVGTAAGTAPWPPQRLPTDLQIYVVWRSCDLESNVCMPMPFIAEYTIRRLGPSRWAVANAVRDQYATFLVEDRVAPKLALVKVDPDYYSIEYYLKKPLPDWRNRPAPRDARTLTRAFAPDPVGTMRMVGPGETTSYCLGQATTPLCAVEARYDCLLRGVGPCQDGPAYRPSTEFWLFRVLAVREVAPDDTADFQVRPPDGKKARMVGDVVIDGMRLSCMPDHGFCTGPAGTDTFTVRRRDDGRWAVVEQWHAQFAF